MKKSKIKEGSKIKIMKGNWERKKKKKRIS